MPAPSPHFTHAAEVRLEMAEVDSNLPSAACWLPYSDLPLTRPYDPTDYDTSLTRQLHQVIEHPASIHHQLDTPPEAYFVTANSAIPVATALRSFFEAKGDPPPTIHGIHANRDISRSFFQQCGCGKIGCDSQEEVDRLRPLAEGLQHVAVIDQYVGTGLTLRCAASMLHMAGAAAVTGIRGNWYYHAERWLVDSTDLSIKNTDMLELMTNIGKEVFRAYRAIEV